MRDLTRAEASQVCGAGTIADAAAVGAALGGALGIGYAAAAGATGTAVLGAAGIGAAGLSGYFVMGQAGWEAGHWLNANTPIQSWISSGIDTLTGGGGGSGGRFPAYENLSD